MYNMEKVANSIGAVLVVGGEIKEITGEKGNFKVKIIEHPVW